VGTGLSGNPVYQDPAGANSIMAAASLVSLTLHREYAMDSKHEDFYVQQRCCTSCGVPQAIAPDLVGWRDENQQLNCYWIKQPETADELDRAIKILHTQELGCHRYSGDDLAILKRCPPEECDRVHPEMALNDAVIFGPSDAPLNLSLSASELNDGFLRRLWRKVTRPK
jgi:hypothetical protein